MGDLGQFGEPETVEELREALARAEQRAEDDRRDTETRLLALENAMPGNAYERKVEDGHHHYQPIEGMDDEVSQGFGYQLDAAAGLVLTRGSWPNSRRLTLSASGSAGPFCFDYLVRPSWTGTEGQEFVFQDSTASFFIYSTLDGAVIAAIAAAGTNGEKTIMVCSSLTAPSGGIEIGGLGSGATIVVTAPDRYAVVVSGFFNSDIFVQNSDGGFTDGRLVFRGIGLAPSTGKAVLDINTGNELRILGFEQCDFSADPGRAYAVRQDGGDPMSRLILRIRECTGALAGFYDVGGGPSETLAPDQLEAFDNQLTLTKWWNISGSGNASPNFTRVRGGYYNVDSGITLQVAGPKEFHWSDLLINYGGSGALFTSASNSTQPSGAHDDWSFTDIKLSTTNNAGTFLNLGSAVINPHRQLYIQNIFGFSAATPTGTFVTVSSNFVNPYVGDIFAPEWPIPYSGPVVEGQTPFEIYIPFGSQQESRTQA